MPKSRTARTRAKRRQAVHQAMYPAQVSAPVRDSGKTAPGGAKSKKLQAQRGRQSLLALLPQLILASININGLSPETEWAVTSILEGQHYDVSAVPLYSSYILFIIRCSV